jgi:ubiquilin
MAEASESSSNEITFNIKASSDAKYSVTLPTTATVAALKEKLSGSDFADLPVDRQRLIFSGRILKDTDIIGDVKIKEGHTVHLVRSAASNARQNPTPDASSNTPTPSIPTNIAAGTGNNPLAHITGARYAGFHNLPGMGSFGPDGGVSHILAHLIDSLLITTR